MRKNFARIPGSIRYAHSNFRHPGWNRFGRPFLSCRAFRVATWSFARLRRCTVSIRTYRRRRRWVTAEWIIWAPPSKLTSIDPGQVLCLVGPSGSGKSTFLRCINHLEQVNAGRLYVDGDLVGYSEKNGKLYELHPRAAAKQRRDIGMVFQHFNLFPHRTALENIIEAPTQVKRVSKKKAVERAKDLLDRSVHASRAGYGAARGCRRLAGLLHHSRGTRLLGRVHRVCCW